MHNCMVGFRYYLKHLPIKYFVSFLIFILFVFPQIVYPYTAEITDISNRDYAEAVIELINKAEESVYIVMYLISYNGKDAESDVYRLMQVLKKANERGVKVEVILDYRSSEDREEGSVSYYAYKLLKDAGIKVNFDTPGIYTHNKTIIIDNKVVVAGSANWSRAALERNNETNLIIESPQLAEELLDRFKQIELIPEKGEEEGEYVLFPAVLLDENGIFQDILSRANERIFDLYLLLLWKYMPGTGGAIDISYREMADGVGLRSKFYRSILNRTLRTMQDKDGLIKIEQHHGGPVDITLLDPVSGEPLDGLAPEKCIKIPEGYWEYGWSKRLNLGEKYCLLINLAEISQEANWNEWMLTRGQMASKYGIDRMTVSGGMMGLRRYGIIDVEYGEIDKGYEERMPAVTRFKGVYDYDAFQKSISEVEDKYGKGLVKQAREYADIVFCGYDLECIKYIIRAIDVYGENTVNEAFSTVKMKSIDNPKRTFKYVVGILKKKGEVSGRGE